MTSNVFEQLRAPADSLRQTREKVFERLLGLTAKDGSRIDFAKIPAGQDLSLGELEARVLGFLDLASPLLGAELGLLPITAVGQLRASIESVTNQLAGAHASLDQLQANGGVNSIPADLGVLASVNGQGNWNVAKWVRGVSNQLDAALAQYSQLASMKASPANVTYDASLEELRRHLQVLRQDREELGKLISQAKEQHQKLSDARAKTEQIAGEAESLRAETEKSRKIVGTHEAETTQKLAAVNAVVAQSEKVMGTLNSLAPQLDQFQTKLEERNKSFAKGQASLDELTSSLRAKDEEIRQINQRAEEMLSGATVSGLASSYGKITGDLTNELATARNGFYVAVALLFVSAVPLAVYVIPGFDLGGVFGDPAGRADFEVGQVVTRLLLLVPTAWLTKFAAARHASLFRLREHYAYKYSIASSVEGFKKQAPSHQEEVAAAAFYALTVNPAERMDGPTSAEEHPNLFTNWLMQKLGFTSDGKPK